MKSTAVIAAIALLAAVGSTPLIAGDRDHDRRSEREHATDVRGSGGFDHTMQEVENNAQPGTQAHGWRYFTDPAAHRAVVISPDGHYYLSRGKGLRWVAGAQTGV